MELMLVTARAILLPLHPFRVQALVLHREVVPIFALAAGEDDLFAWHSMFLRKTATDSFASNTIPYRARDRD